MKQWRIVILGNVVNYYSAFIYGTLEGAIRCGAWAKTVQLVDRPMYEIKKELDWFKPHFIICHMIFGPLRMDILAMLGEMRRRMGTKVIYHMGDAREIPRYPKPIDEWVDLGLVNHGDYRNFSDIWRIPTIHFPYMCFYQKEMADFDYHYKSGLAFTGDLDSSSHHGPRKQFIQNLKRLINIKVYPTPETGNTRFQTAELSSSADGVLGMQMGTNIPLYQDVRIFQYTGAGALYFHDQCEAADVFFEPGVHYVPYKRDNAYHLKEQYDKYTIKEPKEGQKIREEGFKFCQKYHSTKERMQSILNYFEGGETLPIYLNEIQ
ncbi:glycosyltransferase [Patescibacteria group bacterium]|nr:glycosyltransferase [Patescibacteria group bacterium]